MTRLPLPILSSLLLLAVVAGCQGPAPAARRWVAVCARTALCRLPLALPGAPDEAAGGSIAVDGGDDVITHGIEGAPFDPFALLQFNAIGRRVITVHPDGAPGFAIEVAVVEPVGVALWCEDPALVMVASDGRLETGRAALCQVRVSVAAALAPERPADAPAEDVKALSFTTPPSVASIAVGGSSDDHREDFRLTVARSGTFVLPIAVADRTWDLLLQVR